MRRMERQQSLMYPLSSFASLAEVVFRRFKYFVGVGRGNIQLIQIHVPQSPTGEQWPDIGTLIAGDARYQSFLVNFFCIGIVSVSIRWVTSGLLTADSVPVSQQLSLRYFARLLGCSGFH